MAIQELAEAKEIFIYHLQNSDSPKFENVRETSLFNLEEEAHFLSADLKVAIQTLAKYDFNSEVTLFDLPQEIEDTIKKYTTIKEHLHNKSTQEQ